MPAGAGPSEDMLMSIKGTDPLSRKLPMKISFLEYSAILFIYLCVMLIRFVHSGYIKSPRMIKYYQSRGDDANVKKWQQYMQKCRDVYVWIYGFLVFISAMGFAYYELGMFLKKVSSNPVS